jgi:hypothetical protein
MKQAVEKESGVLGETNKLYAEDRAVHDWYHFVLSFPAHLVRDYLNRFGINGSHRVLDPFCGTGTVLVECKKLGISSEGIDANPMARFATKVKTDWSPGPDQLLEHARMIAKRATEMLQADGIEDDPLFGWRRSERSNKLTDALGGGDSATFNKFYQSFAVAQNISFA